MKKIIGLSMAAVLVLGIVSAGTWAFFRDTEVARTTLSAGTLDLKVDGADGVTTFSMTNLKPGAAGFGAAVLNNAGSLSGNLSVASGPATNTENSPAEFNDGSPGDLGSAVNIAIYIDVDQSGTWTDGDIGLKNDGSTYTFISALQSGTVDSYANHNWGVLEQLTSGASDNFHVDWTFTDTGVDQNNCQGDSLSIDFTFTLDQ